MVTEDIGVLTKHELQEISRQTGFELPRAALARKDRLVAYIGQHAPEHVIAVMADEIQKKRCASSRKRGINNDELEERRVHRRMDNFESAKARDAYDVERYLDIPSAEEIMTCNHSFYDRTSNKALKMAICGVCARELLVEEENVCVLWIDEIPNFQRLRPHTRHPAQILVEGSLLAGEAVHETSHGAMVNVCRQCLSSLESTTEAPPMFSLANNMWLGNIPTVLSTLTFPEQLLVSHLYPRVYVFKLYPKKGFAGEASKLQKAMRGTVSTFELDMHGITSMIEGNLMPRPPSLLASLISVTYIGLGSLPKHWLRQFFRVRRNYVVTALLWLKENNPKYYGNVEIDVNRLNCLPEDDIPVELLSIVRQSKEVEVVVEESAGYVPGDDDDDEGDRGKSRLSSVSGGFFLKHHFIRYRSVSDGV